MFLFPAGFVFLLGACACGECFVFGPHFLLGVCIPCSVVVFLLGCLCSMLGAFVPRWVLALVVVRSFLVHTPFWVLGFLIGRV